MSNPSLRIHAPGLVRLEEYSRPALQDGEVGVAVHYVALCGSDIKLYHGAYKAPHRYPVVLGHEWVGVVEETTPAAAEWWIGDVVTGECSLYCGECPQCAKDPNHCRRIEKRGITQDGACARHIAAHSRHLHRCPPGGERKLYALSEPISVAMQGIRNRVPRETLAAARRALIFGAGGIGIAALIALREFAALEITVCDPIEEKLALIRSLGLANVKALPAPPEQDAAYDLIVEAAGSGDALKRALELAAPCASIVCLGHQSEVTINAGLLIQKSLNLMGSIGSAGGFPKAIEAIGRQPEIVAKMITRLVPLTEAVEFFEKKLDHEANVKILIDLTES